MRTEYGHQSMQITIFRL